MNYVVVVFFSLLLLLSLLLSSSSSSSSPVDAFTAPPSSLLSFRRIGGECQSPLTWSIRSYCLSLSNNNSNNNNNNARSYCYSANNLNFRRQRRSSTAVQFLRLDNDDDDDDNDDSLLSYLAYYPPEALPPSTKELIMMATKNYVFGATTRSSSSSSSTNKNSFITTLAEDVIRDEYLSRDVPVVLDGNVTVDVSKTGDDEDELLAEIMSFAALYRLPKEIAYELLGSSSSSSSSGDDDDKATADSNQNSDNNSITDATTTTTTTTTSSSKTSFDLCREVFAEKGWDAVSFPNGLAIELKRNYATTTASSNIKNKKNRLMNFLRRKKLRVEAAQVAVDESKDAIPPKQRLQTREEFLATMEEQFGIMSTTQESSSTVGVSSSTTTTLTDATALDDGDGETTRKLLFFPNSVPSVSGLSWKRIKRATEKNFATLKKKGRPGLVSYCFFNFLLYTAGFLYRWPRLAPADPFSADPFSVCLRKFGRIFMSLYITSQVLKLPRLFASVALTPVSDKCLSFTQKRLRMPGETAATVFLIGLMVIVWIALVSVPILAEYANLKRLVRLDQLINIAPAYQPLACATLQC